MTLFANMAMELDTIPPVNIWTGEGEITVGGTIYRERKRSVFQFGNFEQAKKRRPAGNRGLPGRWQCGAPMAILEGVPTSRSPAIPHHLRRLPHVYQATSSQGPRLEC